MKLSTKLKAMKTIKMPIPNAISEDAIDECIKEIVALKEGKLTCTCVSQNLRNKTHDRVMHITYPDYFEDRDIFITGTLIGAVLYAKPWKK